MCYSAQLHEQYRRYLRETGTTLDFEAFVKLYGHRPQGSALRRPRAMDALFSDPQTDAERQVQALIAADDKRQIEEWQQELFRQRKRLADAERQLGVKATKKAENDARIAGDKVRRLTAKLRSIQSSELSVADARIYPMWYAPVIVWEGGQRVVKPMRYHCRPAGKPASYDTRYPGCYNARRDNLEGFWKQQFGHHHGVLLVNAFYENVSRHQVEGRELAPGEAEQNVVLEFWPRPQQIMHVACIWSRWVGSDGSELLSFAAITDEPPSEVAAAGHDRCIIPVKPENLDAWFQPGGDLQGAYRVLDDRERPYYEHRAAA
tara:strand:- start:2295 stop:3251 length:957 start_codon:yes stop_codon:yes gene_type:complete